MSIDQLFSTPEQGRRLQELVPNIKLNMVWYRYGDGETRPMPLPTGAASSYPFEPALTLQELRDVAIEHELYRRFWLMGAERLETWLEATSAMTAPELAAWIIERLEEQQ